MIDVNDHHHRLPTSPLLGTPTPYARMLLFFAESWGWPFHVPSHLVLFSAFQVPIFQLDGNAEVAKLLLVFR
jgi:hypothetical protein